MLRAFSVGYFACAQYDVKSPIVGFADTSPEGGSAVCFTVFASVAKQSPGRVGSRKAYTYSTLVAGYFAYAGYNAWNNRYFSTPDIRNFLDKSYPKLRSRGLLIFDDIPSG